MIDPALGALGIAHAAPVLELGGDFDRQARAGIDPGDIVILGRTGPDIHMVGFEADISRHRQAAGGDGRILGRKPCADRCAQASTPPAPPPNRNAPTPSTRLLPSYPQLKFFELKPLANARKPQTPVPRFGRPRLVDFRGVLVLARPSDREDGTSRTRTPEFSAENPRQVLGNPRTYLGNSGTPGPRGIAVSNNRVNEV